MNVKPIDYAALHAKTIRLEQAAIARKDWEAAALHRCVRETIELVMDAPKVQEVVKA